MDFGDPGGEQLELTLGPLYHVVVEDHVSGPLTGRTSRDYRSPPQSLEDARSLAALLLDRGGELDRRRPVAPAARRRPAPRGDRAAPRRAARR